MASNTFDINLVVFKNYFRKVSTRVKFNVHRVDVCHTLLSKVQLRYSIVYLHAAIALSIAQTDVV